MWTTFAILCSSALFQDATPSPDAAKKDPPIAEQQQKTEQKAQTTEQKEAETFEIAPVVVTPMREYRSSLWSPAEVTSKARDAALRESPENLPDAMAEEPGMWMQKSNMGAGSPILRGRSGKDVMQLLDGQRFNNTTFRRNHQYMSTIDFFAVDSFEIVHGPASVLYGSDAMGGAINMITHRAEARDEWGFQGSTYLQYETVDKGFTTHVDAEAGGDGWGFGAGFTTRSFDDLKAGSVGDPIEAVDIDGKQDPTGYHERDFNCSLTRRLSENDSLDYFLLYDRQYSVPTSERVIANEKQPNPSDLIRETDPQRLNWQMLRFRHQNEGATLDSFQAQISLNNPTEGRRRVRTSAPAEVILEDDEVFAPGISTQAGFNWLEQHHLIVGAEGYFETVSSDRRVIDTSTGTAVVDPNGRYPDGSTYDSYGMFAQDEWNLDEDWQWINGLRYSIVNVDADFDGLVVGTLPAFGHLSETYNDVSLTTGLVRRIDEYTSMYASVSRGFRAPNLDDLAVLGDFSAGDRVPNFDLDPETVWNFEIGARHESPVTAAGVALAHARYQNLLANQFLFSAGGTDFFQVQNSSHAYTWTIESWIDHVIHVMESGITSSLFAQFAWTIGRDTTEDEPMSKVPPPDAIVGYRLENPETRTFAETYARGAAKQDRLSAADEADPRFPFGGTPAWWTLNVRGGVDVMRNVTLIAALENIFNYRYRVHGFGIDAPGRNFVLSLQWRF